MLSHMDKKYIEDLINLFFDRLDQSLQIAKDNKSEDVIIDDDNSEEE